MRVNRLTGIKTLLGFGPQIANSVTVAPDGLLLHENMVYSLFPMHVGMRQYWHDMDSLLSWSRAEPHRQWWKGFLRDSGGTSFWHETYLMRGGMEAVYDVPTGFMKFAPVIPVGGPMFGADHRATGPQTLPLIQSSAKKISTDLHLKSLLSSLLRANFIAKFPHFSHT
jgi:hypothetical protein